MRKILLLSLFATLAFASDIFLHQFFNKNVCDQVLNNDGYFKTCYCYKMKGAKYVAYKLDGNLVGAVNIKKRPKFYPDLHIPRQYRANFSDYIRNMYHLDRGHLANDAAFDYSQRSLKAVYVLSNIIPQYFKINRSKEMWAGVERYARYVARKLGYVNVLNGVKYGNNPRRIGRDKIAVPYAYWKMIYNKKNNYQKCFYFKNVNQSARSIREFVVDCRELY